VSSFVTEQISYKEQQLLNSNNINYDTQGLRSIKPSVC